MINASFSPFNQPTFDNDSISNNERIDETGLDNIMNDESNEISRLYKTLDDTRVENLAFCNEVYENLLKIDQKVEIEFPSIRHQVVAFSKVLNKAILNLKNTKKTCSNPEKYW